MQRILKPLLAIMPLIFAFGFVAPVIAQGMNATGLSAPFGLSTLVFGLIIAGLWGVFAQITGRCI